MSREAGVSGVEVSDRLVLRCAGCCEMIVLLGREDDWLGGGPGRRNAASRETFPCGGCGRRLSLGSRVVVDGPTTKKGRRARSWR